MNISQDKKQNYLWKILCILWYVTIFAAVFREYLFKISLPFGGHLFLFRLLLPVVTVLYLVWAFKYKYNPFKEMTKTEWSFVILAGVMLCYGTLSAFFAFELGAWFSKFTTIAYALIFVELYLLFSRDKAVRRITLTVFLCALLICLVGGFLECFTDAFFETPYAGETRYVFFGKKLYAPIFCFYNTNGFVATLVFGLAIGAVYLAENWNILKKRYAKLCMILITGVLAVTYFLIRAGSARLGYISFLILLGCYVIWLCFRSRRSLLLLIPLVLFIGFVHVGENYEAIRAEWQIGTNTEPEVNEEQNTPPEDVIPAPPQNDMPDVPEQEPEEETDTSVPPEEEAPLVNVVAPITTLQESDHVRWSLIKNGLDMLLDSGFLGVGVGNGEIMLAGYQNTMGITNFHCFIVEVMAEFGLFAILPALVLVFLCFRAWIIRLICLIRQKNGAAFADLFVMVGSVLMFPFLSMANSSSWGLMAMWLYLAFVLHATLGIQRKSPPPPAEVLESGEQQKPEKDI